MKLVAFDKQGLATHNPHEAHTYEWINEAGNTVHADPANDSIVLVIESDDLDGGYIAEWPHRPGCVSQGETISEATRNAADALDAVNSLGGDGNKEPALPERGRHPKVEQ